MSSEEHHTPLLKPLPRRPFELSSSNDSSIQSSPYIGSNSTDDSHLDPSSANNRADVSRTRSILNLTSSTLFGIYGPTAGSGSTQDASQPPTPWGTGAETPLRDRHSSIDDASRSASLDLTRVRTNNASEIEALLLARGSSGGRRKARSPSGALPPPLPLHHAPESAGHALFAAGVRAAVLFGFGVAYGALVARLRVDAALSRVDGGAGWRVLVFWGLAGVAIGHLLPWVDGVWDGAGVSARAEAVEGGAAEEHAGPRKRGLGGVEWSDVVRGVGAFVGVAFAIRKLAWSSTLQLSLTLGLANPFLWYLLDRTSAGFTLSAAIGLVGTVVLFFVNPSVIPVPTSSLIHANVTAAGVAGGASAMEGFTTLEALLHSEGVGIAAWIASVLFCSCVCFGNIGRLLVRERLRER